MYPTMITNVLSNLLLVIAIVFALYGAVLAIASVMPERWLRHIMRR